MEKQNLIQQKHAFNNQNKGITTQNKHKKLKPGLVASYNMRPGNEEGLFLYRCFVNLSLTYLLTHLPTYLQRLNCNFWILVCYHLIIQCFDAVR